VEKTRYPSTEVQLKLFRWQRSLYCHLVLPCQLPWVPGNLSSNSGGGMHLAGYTQFGVVVVVVVVAVVLPLFYSMVGL
jgi:hypothetical protein